LARSDKQDLKLRGKLQALRDDLAALTEQATFVPEESTLDEKI
jgi:hypothetical protein